MSEKVVYTAIFGGQYDDLKEPLVVTPGWQYICFTDQLLTSRAWEIVRVPVMERGPQRTARFYKLLFHRHITARYSLWIDGSFRIACNLDEWWNARFRAPVTFVRHPDRNCFYEEAAECLRVGRGEPEKILQQVEIYKKSGLPARGGMVGSGLIMREHCPETIRFCELWHEHVYRYSSRDQLAWAWAAWKYPIYHIDEWKYNSQTFFLKSKHKVNIYH